MNYDWKQLSAKIAKIGVTFLATGGVAAIGGAAPATALLAGLTSEAIADGIGEIAEGIVSGIQPKDKDVYTKFQSAVMDCVLEQLKKADCPHSKLQVVQSEIIETFFGEHSNIIVAATKEPQIATTYVKTIFSEYLPGQNISDEEAITFVDRLFSELVKIIDEDHEFTTIVYLKSIITAVKSLQKSTDETISNKLNRLLEMVNMILIHIESDNERSTIKRESAHYTFVFRIGADGQALELSNITQNAIREWFYDCAREDLSFVPDERLADTFIVTIDDERVNQAQDEIDAIDIRIKAGERLDTLGEYNYSKSKKIVNRIHKENQIKAAAIKFYLSDRMGYGIFNTLSHLELMDIIIKILEFSYFDTYELDNNREYIKLDVYLNFSGHNQNHERFIAYMKKCDVKACFGGTGIYDIYGSCVFDMGEFKHVIAPYFYQHLGRLKVIDKFDFSQNKRLFNLYNYYVGLH
nr:hypothetical protein [uncultured Oscillibacter sp.]